MPDDYYVSQYSGEEIDERLTAAHNAVRYDAAQSLTDEQKAQARTNINAAPGNFGFGALPPVISDPDSLSGTADGIYQFYSPDHPIGIDDVAGILIHYQGNFREVTSSSRQIFYPVGKFAYHLERAYSGTWTEWEYVNPPMQLGVEYRTTERYLGKPVYYKVVNFGNLPDTAGKGVAHGIANAQCMIDVTLQGSNGSTFTHNANDLSVYANLEDVYIKTLINLSNYAVYATLRYIKTTD